jgi:electron transport complex protein RnfC
VRIVPVKTRYPQEDERQLADAVLGIEIASGKSSIDNSALIFSAGTLFAVYEAVALSKPFIERIITVSGDAVRRQANLKVRIGTPVRDLLEECGGFRKQPAKLVIGGPMRGYAVGDAGMPVTKTTSGILVLTEAEIRRAQRYNCVQCGHCVRACPIGLEPVVLHKLIEHGRYAEAVELGLFDCTECGCCAYSCPSRIPLVQSLKTGKIYIDTQGSSS